MFQKFQKTLGLLPAIILFLPLVTYAKVSVNEVAWMGNDKSQYGEWIELYNTGPDAVDLKDAALYEGGGKTLIIKLTKSIAPGGYYLIARSTPSMPDPVNGLADDLGSFGGSGLSNSGEFLVLKSASGDTLDSLDASTGWPAGDSATKQTMQWTGSAWVTATGTPRAANASVALGANSSGNGSADITSGDATSEPDFSGLSAHASPADLSSLPPEVKIFASAGRNRLAMVGGPVSFEEKLFNSSREDLDGGNVSWSFGDGQTATGKLAVHAYLYPGDYVVVMNVLKNADSYVARANVRVVPADLAITAFTSDAVKIYNQSAYEANVGQWQLVSRRLTFTIPEDTIILPNHEVIFPKLVTGLGGDLSSLKLVSPARETVSTFSPSVATSSSVTAAPIASADVVAALASAEARLLEARRELDAQSSAKISAAKPIVTVAVSHLNNSKEEIEPSVRIPSVSSVQIIEPSKSIFQKIIELPSAGLRYIRNFF